MAIYLDIVWLLNFLIDLLLLLLTAKLLKRDVKRIRLLAGALLGSCIVLLMFTPLSYIVSAPAGKMIYSFCIILMTFGFKRFRSFLQAVAVFYLVTFMIGGGIVGVHYFLQTNMQVMDNVLIFQSTGLGDPVSWVFVFIAFPTIWWFSKRQMEQLETRKVHFDQLVKVEIKIDEIYLTLNGLIDSGNQLTDPITKVPVMILDVTRIKEAIPIDLVEISKNSDDVMDLNFNETWSHRLRIIPYRGIGQDSKFLLAVKPDMVVIVDQEKRYRVPKVLIGLNHTQLSSEGEYECILHPEMLIHKTQSVS